MSLSRGLSGDNIGDYNHDIVRILYYSRVLKYSFKNKENKSFGLHLMVIGHPLGCWLAINNPVEGSINNKQETKWQDKKRMQ